MPHAMQIRQTGGPEVLKQFWQFIKYVFYIPERREYIWQEIRPLTGRAASKDDFAKRARLAQDQHPRIANDEISTKFHMAWGGNA